MRASVLWFLLPVFMMKGLTAKHLLIQTVDEKNQDAALDDANEGKQDYLNLHNFSILLNDRGAQGHQIRDNQALWDTLG